MEWRCTWCGKPHAEDDPPCDNCGHNKFERAVEQMAPQQDGPTEPVWVCTECGRQHTKHSPPCSRCGNVDLEKRRPDYSDLEDIGGTTYRDVLEPKYVAGYALVAVLGSVLILAQLGVVTLPGMGKPAIPDTPGDGEQVGGLSIDGVEAAYVEELNERRADAGVGALSNDSDLAWYATYVNKRTVGVIEGNASSISDDEFGRVREYCDGRPVVDRYRTGESVLDVSDESSLAAALVDGWTRRERAQVDSQTAIGVDVHVGPSGRVYVTVAVC